jgi:hypothetical protein
MRMSVLVALALLGCTSTRVVPRGELTRVARGDLDDGVALRTTSTFRSRLEPNATVRLVSPSGEKSPAHHASALSVNRRGVFVEEPAQAPAGWAWDEIEGVELTTFSGGKTFGGIVATTALAVALAPLALLVRMPGTVQGATGDGGGGRGSSGSSGGGAALADVAIRAASDAPADDGRWAPSLHGDAAAGAVRLFNGRTRRRAIVRLFAIGEAAADLRRPDVLAGGVALGVRLADVIELGGGARQLLARTPAGLDPRTVGFFRFGLHLPLDAGHRLAVPLGFDVGGGDHAHLFRIQLGLRARLRKNFFAGVFPFSPTRVRFVDDSAASDLPRWSWTSGVEFGAAF